MHMSHLYTTTPLYASLSLSLCYHHSPFLHAPVHRLSSVHVLPAIVVMISVAVSQQGCMFSRVPEAVRALLVPHHKLASKVIEQLETLASGLLWRGSSLKGKGAPAVVLAAVQHGSPGCSSLCRDLLDVGPNLMPGLDTSSFDVGHIVDITRDHPKCSHQLAW